MAGKIYIGTSGWSYKHWRGMYYPEKMKPVDYLEYYSREFNIAEINTSFYHLPKIQSVLNWMEKVPKKFRFCPKMSRYLTHMKKLHDPEESLQKFFSVFDEMQLIMGPVLVQLPPALRFNKNVTEHFFSVLSNQYAAYDFVLEIRHTSWLEAEPLDLLKEYNIGFVISQSKERFPYAEHVTSENIYVRFHGPEELYASAYSDEQLKHYSSLFISWLKKKHNVWAFFNNDIHGHAFRDAARLKKLMKKYVYE